MFHIELRQFPHVARVFNLSRTELDARFVVPWTAGAMIEHDDRRWAPDRVQLTILEGPPLARDEVGMGRGWANAARGGRDVTQEVIAAARRGAAARPEVAALKAAVAQVLASGPEKLTPADVVGLAAAAQPTWRPSQQLELAEQTVWEMLHQGRLTMTVHDRTVAPEQWQGIVLSWASWTAAAGEGPVIRLAGSTPQ
jgi:hypothetical protein